MPELPEVETICRELSKTVIGKEIIDFKELREKTFLNKEHLSLISKIISVERIAKMIVINLDNQNRIVVHLRMTGKLIYPAQNDNINKHTRAVFALKDNEIMLFDDIRTFGKIHLQRMSDSIQDIQNIGIDPFSNSFNKKYLLNISKNRTVPIKNFLLDQTIIAGLGNIYVQEILFITKISPLRKTNQIKPSEWDAIIKTTQEILTEAIKCNGTTISDFRRVDDKKGEFQNFLKVYGKKSCPICSNELTLIKQSGRSTRYCAHCQK